MSQIPTESSTNRTDDVPRILIVEDEASTRTMCERALTDAGYVTISSASAEDALELLAQPATIDLLIADIQLPGKSGLELAEEVQAIDPAIAVVVMTGHASLENVQQAARRGIADFLSKPFELDALRIAVEQALHKRRLLQERLRLRTFEELLTSSASINAILDRRHLVTVILERARTHVACAAGFIILHGEQEIPSQVIGIPTEARLLEAGQEAALFIRRQGGIRAFTAPTPICAVQTETYQRGLAVALHSQGNTIGVLLLADEREDLLTSTNQDTLSLLANQAGAALRNAFLYDELDHAYRSLRELDRLKAEFLSIASHELRNPLAIVMGYAKMLRDQIDEPQRELAHRTLEGAQRIHSIVEGMFRLHDYERLDQQNLILERHDLRDVTEQVIERFRSATDQKRQSLHLQAPAAAVTTYFDREMMLIALSNLIDNAIRFTPSEGTISAVVSPWSHQQLQEALTHADVCPTRRRLTEAVPETWGVVQIRDDGIGIDPSQAPRIFESFYQTADSLTRSEGGAGLGLALVRDIARLHRGMVWMQSTPHQGSNFYLALPVDA
jgi:signal transduction histidine kinase